ncbi:MAG: hypothetical protein ACK4ND_18430 [Cytophagaceae bacterium]
MKTRFLSVVFLVAFVVYVANAAVSLRYYNKDSVTHVFSVKIGGSSSKVEFGSSRTASVTIQGGSEEAIISCNCGDVKVRQGDSIEISNGCITIK